MTIPKQYQIENLKYSKRIVNNLIQLVIKFVLEMEGFSVSTIMEN